MAFNKDKFLADVKQFTNWDALSLQATTAFTGWSSQDPNVYFDKMQAVLNVCEEIVDTVEKVANEVDDLSGKDKLEAAISWIDSLVQFPWYADWATDMAIRMIMSTIVQQKNKWFGKDWIKTK